MDIHYLIDANKKMAKTLLEEFEEYYPFGYGLNSNLEVRNIEGLTQSDTPEPLEVVEELEKVLQIAANHDCALIAVSICIDVRIILKGKAEKMDALYIKINKANEPPLDVIIPYIIKDGIVEFHDKEEQVGKQYVVFR